MYYLQAIEAFIMYLLFCGLMYTSIPSLSLNLLFACRKNIVHVGWYLVSPTCSQHEYIAFISITVTIDLDLVTTDLCTLCIPFTADIFEGILI